MDATRMPRFKLGDRVEIRRGSRKGRYGTITYIHRDPGATTYKEGALVKLDRPDADDRAHKFYGFNSLLLSQPRRLK